MVATAAVELWSGRAGDFDKATRTYTRIQRVTTSDVNDDATHVKAFPTVPNVGDPHPSDGESWCVSVNCRNESFSRTQWLVTSNYSSERELADSPLDEPARIRWNSEQYQKPAVKDRNGDAILNSAGDPFDPPPEMDDSRRVIQIEKNLAVVPAWILTYQDAVNDAEFEVDGVTIAAGKAKVQDVAVSEVQEQNDVPFRVVSLEIQLERDGWALSILDAGFRELDASGSLIQILNDGDNKEVTTPAPLDGAGSALSTPTVDTAVFIDFDVYVEKDFSALPLV